MITKFKIFENKNDNFYKIRDIYDRHDNKEDFINEMKELFMGKNISVMEEYDGVWEDIPDGWGRMIVEKITWDDGIHHNQDLPYEEKINVMKKMAGRVPYVVVINSLRVSINEAIKINKVIISEDDPYGEEDWDDMSESVDEDWSAYQYFDEKMKSEGTIDLEEILDKFGGEAYKLYVFLCVFIKGKTVEIYHEDKLLKRLKVGDVYTTTSNPNADQVIGFTTEKPDWRRLFVFSKKYDYTLKIVEPVRVFSDNDPYGEEEWEDEIFEK